MLKSGAVPCTCLSHPNPFLSAARKVWALLSRVANVVWGYWLGEKNIFVLPYPTPHHPPCTLLLLFCKHHHCSQSKLSFQVHFQLFFRIGFKWWSRWSNANPGQPRLWGGCRNPGMEPGLLCSHLSPKAAEIPPRLCTRLCWWSSISLAPPPLSAAACPDSLKGYWLRA